MKISPCFNKVLLRIEEDQESLVSLPDGTMGARTKLFVEAMGPDVKCCKVGDLVLIRPNTNMAFIGDHIAEDKQLSIVDDSTIFAILE